MQLVTKSNNVTFPYCFCMHKHNRQFLVHQQFLWLIKIQEDWHRSSFSPKMTSSCQGYMAPVAVFHHEDTNNGWGISKKRLTVVWRYCLGSGGFVSRNAWNPDRAELSWELVRVWTSGIGWNERIASLFVCVVSL